MEWNDGEVMLAETNTACEDLLSFGWFLCR